MKTIAFLAILGLSTSFACGWSMQETRPATTPAAATTAAAAAPDGQESLIATVTGVEGIAQVRTSADAEWQPAKVGMQVGENAEFRTGPRGAVRFVIPPDHTITVDRLSTVKVLQAINDKGVIRTQMGMKYGRTRYSIEAAGREHESAIVSPSSTLSVRGTDFSAYDQRPFPAMGVRLRGGQMQFRDRKKRVVIGQSAGKTKIDVNSPNAASLALDQAVVDPGARLARTPAEERLVTNLLSSGATIDFDVDKGIRVVRGGVPPTDDQLIPTLPGVLNFVARWHSNSDLNFSAGTPGGVNNAGETIYPIGTLQTNSSGGRIPFDHRGGPNGGIEVIFFPTMPPDGLYGLGLTLISGPETTAQVDAFLNGQRIGIFDGQQVVQSASIDVIKPIPGFVDGTAAGVVPINVDLPLGPGAPGQPPAQRPDRKGNSRTTLALPSTGKPLGPTPPPAPASKLIKRR